MDHPNLEGDDLQRRDVPGVQRRAQARHADIVRSLRDADLPNIQRGVVIDSVGTAFVRDDREPLGGARYLEGLAEQMPNLPRLRDTVRRLSTAFVHPPLR
jgi:hypothetical protein